MGQWDGEWDAGRGLRIVLGAERKVRAVIAEDGEVTDGGGNTLAYIESNGEVGDPQMNYVGKADQQGHQIADHDMPSGNADPPRERNPIRANFC